MHILEFARMLIPGLAMFALLGGLLLAACSTTEPIVDEIIAKSRTHFEAATSYEAEWYYYQNPNSDESTGTQRGQIRRPTDAQFISDDGSIHAVSIGGTNYRRSIQNPGKWVRYISEGPPLVEAIDPFFPAKFLEPELVGSDGDFYVVEGFGPTFGRASVNQHTLVRSQLKIRKSDFALSEFTNWSFPILEVDDSDQIIERRFEEEGEIPFDHMRNVVELSRYNEEFTFTPPLESDIVIELIRSWPEPAVYGISRSQDIGFILTEAAPIMDLTVDPAVQLVQAEFDSPIAVRNTGARNFNTKQGWEKETTYTATLKWGETESDLNTHTWTFTTRAW